MPEFTGAKRTRVVRAPKRARYDRETVYAILDEALFCTVAFVDDGGRPVAIPINHWRTGDRLYFHGSSASRLMKILCAGAEVCVTVTLLDGLVMARSAFHHSVNYRSVVVFGQAREIADPDEKTAALADFVNRVAPGRWDEIRHPTASEMKATHIAALPLDEASAKVRTGGPIDDEADYALPVWAGIVPLSLRRGDALPDDRLDPKVPVPAYLRPGEDGA